MQLDLKRLLTIYNPRSAQPEHMCELLLQAGGDDLPELLAEEYAELEQFRDEDRARTALTVLAPVATRLNMQSLKRDLEDIAFSVLHPEQYRLTQKMLASKEADSRKSLLKFIHSLQASLSEAGIEAVDVSGRTKQPYSLYKKLRKSGTISDVHDLLAVRVIVSTEEQCYEVLDVINNKFHPVLARFKDYIKQPKPNGYRSLHATLEVGKNSVEVQIRTPKMHEHAEGGAAAHWQYDQHKHSKGYKKGVASVYRQASDSYIYVFSPQGDPYRLREGATALDFAFHVHTGVGLRTKNVVVNGAIVTLDYCPVSGDQIEVITGKEARPKNDWLRIVTSRKARARIRTWLREADRDRYIATGKDMVNAEFGKISKTELSSLLSEYGLAEIDDLLVAVGAGYISTRALRQRLQPTESPLSRAGKQPESPREKRVVVSGMSGLQYRLAQCCHPQSPVPITGYITQSLGITVHRSDCSEIGGEKQRLVDCHWA